MNQLLFKTITVLDMVSRCADDNSKLGIAANELRAEIAAELTNPTQSLPLSRSELARDILIALIKRNHIDSVPDYVAMYAQDAVQLADALIAELGKGKVEG